MITRMIVSVLASVLFLSLVQSCTNRPVSSPQCPPIDSCTATCSSLDSMLIATFFALNMPADTVRLIVLGDRSTPYLSSLDSGDTVEWLLHYLAASMPSIRKETVASYIARNAHPCRLHFRTLARLPVRCLSPQESCALFTARKTWDIFRNKFRHAAGYQEISLPGLSADSTQMLLCWGCTWGGLAGAGKYILLERANGGWRIVATCEAWVS
jgi:hypothetical protein